MGSGGVVPLPSLVILVYFLCSRPEWTGPGVPLTMLILL